MHTFTSRLSDGAEVQWEIDLTFANVRRLKGLGLVNLLEPTKPLSEEDAETSFSLMRSNLERFVDVIWALVEKQAKEKGVDATQFAESLDHESFSECRKAFFQEWEDFFLQSEVPERAAELRKQIEATDETANRIKAIATVDLMGPIQEAIESVIRPKSFTS